MGEQGGTERGGTSAGWEDQAGASILVAIGGGPDSEWREVAPGVHARGDAPDRLLLGGGLSGRQGASAGSSGRQAGRQSRAGGRSRAGGMSRLAGRRGLWALVAAVFVVVMGVGVMQRGPTGASVAASPTSGPSPSTDARVSAAGETAAAGEVPSGTSESPAPAGASAVPSGSSSAEPGGDVDWWSVLGELDVRRSAAIESLDLAALDAYALVDSPAWQADAALIADLQQRELRPAGLSTQVIAIEEATPIDAEGSGVAAAVQLVIVDRREAYSLVDPAGDTVQAVPPAESRRWRMVLQPGEDDGAGWLVRSAEEVT